MFEKFPKGYNAKAIQEIYERIVGRLTKSEKKQDDAIKDLSKELSTKIETETAKLSKKIGGDVGVPTHLPLPQGLKVYELLVAGIATVNPFKAWKYFGKVRGYEFYGSHTTGFSPNTNTTTLSGVHYGKIKGAAVLDSAFLWTKDEDVSANSLVLEGGLAGLTVENVAQGTSGAVYNWGLGKPYKLYASGVRWANGDNFRILKYPSNRLFSIGAFCYFLKYPLIPFYVKARTVGAGHSFSDFTAQVASFDITAPPAPTITGVTFSDIYYPFGGDSAKVDMYVEYPDYDDDDGVVDVEARVWEGKDGVI